MTVVESIKDAVGLGDSSGKSTAFGQTAGIDVVQLLRLLQLRDRLCRMQNSLSHTETAVRIC